MRSSTHFLAGRFATLVFVLLLAGCGEAPPRLQYVRIGLDEDNSPVILGVELQNVGAKEATIDGCDVKLLSTHLFVAAGDSSPWPEKFEHHVELWETQEGRTIAPGESGLAGIAFVWDLPPTAPRLIAVCKASFTVRYDAAFKVKIEEVMFVVASSAEARQKILGEPLSNVTDASELADRFESFEGKRSSDVEQVIQLLRESQP